MKDMIPKGTGNSRKMKSSIPANITHEELVALLRNGDFPFDLNGLNPEGITQQGTPLNKAALLQDDTAQMLGVLAENPTVDDAFDTIASTQDGLTQRVTALEQSVGVDTVTLIASQDYTFPSTAVSVEYEIIGGGGGGGGGADGGGGGGGSGGRTTGTLTAEQVAGQTIAMTVGIGGAGGEHGVSQGDTGSGGQTGGTGGTTSIGTFASVTGGHGGGGGGRYWSGHGSGGGGGSGGTPNGVSGSSGRDGEDFMATGSGGGVGGKLSDTQYGKGGHGGGHLINGANGANGVIKLTITTKNFDV